MEWQGPEFIIAIVALCSGAWILNNWIRARHGYALEDEWGGKTERAETVEFATLRAQNAALAERLAMLERRTGSLETIVADPAYATAGSIEALRDWHGTVVTTPEGAR